MAQHANIDCQSAEAHTHSDVAHSSEHMQVVEYCAHFFFIHPALFCKETSAIARWRGNLLRFQTGNVSATTFGFISKRAANNKPGGAAPGCILCIPLGKVSLATLLSTRANTRRIIIFTRVERLCFARAQVQGIPDTFAHG